MPYEYRTCIELLQLYHWIKFIKLYNTSKPDDTLDNLDFRTSGIAGFIQQSYQKIGVGVVKTIIFRFGRALKNKYQSVLHLA